VAEQPEDAVAERRLDADFVNAPHEEISGGNADAASRNIGNANPAPHDARDAKGQAPAQRCAR